MFILKSEEDQTIKTQVFSSSYHLVSITRMSTSGIIGYDHDGMWNGR